MLRQLERQITCIHVPSKTPERSIAMNAKLREARNLSDKVHEVQKLIDQLDDPTAIYVYQDQLDSIERNRRELINPTIYIECEC